MRISKIKMALALGRRNASLAPMPTPNPKPIEASYSSTISLSKRSTSKQIEQVASQTYHKMSEDDLNRAFNTSCTQGLTSEEAAKLLAKNGANVLPPPRTHLMRQLLGYSFGGFCSLLWIGALICFLAWKPIGSPPDPTNLGLGVLLLIVIALQAAFEAFQDWSSSKVMQSIKGMMSADATCIRDGMQVQVPAANLVVGDLVLLTYGNKVPADLRIIDANDLKFDRAMLTGESEAVEGNFGLALHSFFSFFFNNEYKTKSLNVKV